jgi:MFS family permease
MKMPKVFYGYWIVVVLFYSVAIYSANGFYTFSLFTSPLQTDFGWSIGQIMVAITLFFIVTGAVSPFVGKLVERYGAKKVISFGALISGLGFALLPLVQGLWQFYAGYVTIGVGTAAMGVVPATAVISNWFRKRRGTALGIMSTGIGAGGLALAPFIGSYVVPDFGWQTGYLAMACFNWIVIPLVLLVIKMKPADIGLYPDNVLASEVEVTASILLPAEGFSLKMALATATFWLMAVTYFTSAFCQVAIVQNQVPYLDDIGFHITAAATALGVVGLGSLIGKFGFGWLCDRMPAKYVWCIALTIQLIAIIILLKIGPESSSVMLWLYAFNMGLGMGGLLPTMSMQTSNNFGLASYGLIFGMITFIENVGCAVGPLFAGYMYDAMGTYQLAFTIFLALYAVAIPAALAVRRPALPSHTID